MVHWEKAEIRCIADEYGALNVEDAAESLGAKYKYGERLGGDWKSG